MPFLAPNFRRFNPFLAPNFRRFNPFLAPNFRKTSIFAPDYQCITNYEKYLKRHIDKELEIWAKSQERKPLLLRGARQVGKTSAVRHLAEEFEYFAEVDFNERTDIH